MTLKGSTVVLLVNVVVPLYLCIGFGYISSRVGMLPHNKTLPGISGFLSKVAVPFLVFRMVASNDPYTINGKLIAADTLCKVIILLALSLNCFYRPSHQYIAWVNSIFNLAAIPNSILIGTPLLTALYPGTGHDVTTLVFMQLLVWFSVIIFLLELHKVVYEMSKDFDAEVARQIDLEALELRSIKNPLPRISEVVAIQTKQEITSSSSPDQGRSSTGKDRPRLAHIIPEATTDLTIPIPAAEYEGHGADTNCAEGAQEEAVLVKLTKPQIAKRIAKTVLIKLFWAPIIWGSLLGFVYALINFKYNNGMPLTAILKGFVDLLANCTLGLVFFLVGMDMGVSPKFFACGIPMALLGAFIRFIISPAIMAVASIAVGLKGDIFRFAVLQAVVPQAVLSFVLATQYKVHEDLFETAVWFQTATFLPFAIGLYLLLEVGSGTGQ